MMKIAIDLYGGLRQRAGAKTVEITVDKEEPTVADAIFELQRQIPALSGALGSVARALGDEIVDDDHRIEPGDSLALLPPVSGGRPRPWLSPTPLDRDRLIKETDDDRCGALIIFSGDIRNHNDGRDDVVAIEYEAHTGIAAKVLETIEKEVVQRFDVYRCRIQHRVGRVEVGQSSVLVVCRAPHRDAAFVGARYAIDELKERTPIWKHEHYADGQSKYLDGTPLRTEPENKDDE